MKKRYFIIIIILSTFVFFLLGLWVGKNIMAKKEDNSIMIDLEHNSSKDIVETQSKETELIDENKAKITSITIAYNYDVQNKSYKGELYQLSLKEGVAQFHYYDMNFNDIYCDFSIDKFNELMDMVEYSNLVEYNVSNRVDENGKIQYEVIPIALLLYSPGMSTLYETPNNIKEIDSFMNKLLEVSKE